MNEAQFQALREEMERTAAEHDVDACRLITFYEAVGDLTGPYEPLLREIAHAYSVFQMAKESYSTTEGEGVRMGWILDAAMTYVESARDEATP
jgi:hypothetical protein